MKIDSPKFAPASRTTERPQLSTTTATPKNGNTGIVPTAAQPKPADTFEKPATGSASSNTGIVPTSTPKPTSISTYVLPAHLEPHREKIDKYGSHIAKLPTHVQGQHIVKATDDLHKDLGDIASWDELNKAVNDSVAYYAASHPSTSNDPQCLRVTISGDTFGTPPPAQDYAKDFARDFGRAITQDPSTQDPRSLLRSLRRQPRQPQQQQADETQTRQLFRRMPRWF